MHKVRIMSSGWAPPTSGPQRDSYLLENGQRFLQGSYAAFNKVVELIGDIKIPKVVSNEDKQIYEANVNAARAEWSRIRAHYFDKVESELRTPIEAAVLNAKSALNFLEDTDLCNEAHGMLHLTAQLRFGFLGCPLKFEDGILMSDCPVRVGHQRWGLSPELVTEWNCSICGCRFDICPHIPGEQYKVEVHRTGTECNACYTESCNHRDGETVLVEAHRVAASVKTIGIATVARPRDPLARAEVLSLGPVTDPKYLALAEAGELRCSECILPCAGFRFPHGLK